MRPIPTEMRTFGFHAHGGVVHEADFSAAVHTEIELDLVLSGQMRYFIGGSFKEAVAGRLHVFWGGTPHRAVWVHSPTEYIGIHVPLDWVLGWPLVNTFAQRLLAGEWFEEPDRGNGRVDDDRSLFVRWANDIRGADPEMRQVVALEVEARLRRLAASVATRASGDEDPAHVGGAHIEHAARFIASRYREHLTLPDIAAATGLHPNSLCAVFKRLTGMSVWEYVLRMRVAHAQRLLVESELSVLDVAIDAGFGSTTPFYGTFKRSTGVSPAHYRSLHRLES